MQYSLYGLRVESNRALHGVQPLQSPAGAAADVELTFAGESAIPAAWAALSWRLAREQQGDDWILRGWTASTAGGVAYRLQTWLGREDTTLLFSPAGSHVRIHWRRVSTEADEHWADLSAWVLDAALGHAARLRGWPVLHGNVVAVDGRAIGLLGHQGAGKSTLAAAFVAGGCPMLADDHVVLRQDGAAFVAQPGPPRFRLWPASLPVLAGQAADLPRAYSQHEKRLLDLSPDGAGSPARFHHAPLPLRALYLLGPRDPSRSDTTIEPLVPAAALLQALVYRRSQVHISSEHAAAELAALARLSQDIPIRRVYRPDGIDTLGHVVDAIREDVNACAR